MPLTCCCINVALFPNSLLYGIFALDEYNHMWLCHVRWSHSIYYYKLDIFKYCLISHLCRRPSLWLTRIHANTDITITRQPSNCPVGRTLHHHYSLSQFYTRKKRQERLNWMKHWHTVRFQVSDDLLRALHRNDSKTWHKVKGLELRNCASSFLLVVNNNSSICACRTV